MLTSALLLSYIAKCSTHVAPSTMLAIIKTESKFRKNAININGNYKLAYQPQSQLQAVHWVDYLEKHNYNFDIGLMQINIKNVHKYGYKASDALDPCTNIRLGSEILKSTYAKALNQSNNSQDALMKALSGYNTGNFYSGFNNGYVKNIVANNQYIDN